MLPLCFIHGGFNQENILIEDIKVSGILDVEWAHSGFNEIELVCVDWNFFYSRDKQKYRDYFYSGYEKKMKISKDFEKRKVLFWLIRTLNAIDAYPAVIDKMTKNKAKLRYGNVLIRINGILEDKIMYPDV